MIEVVLPELNDYFYITHLDRIPEKNGIYVLYNFQKEILYIGKSKNLRKRLKEHVTGKTHTKDHHKEFKLIRFFTEECMFATELYETFMINVYKAKYNKSKIYSVKSIKAAEGDSQGTIVPEKKVTIEGPGHSETYTLREKNYDKDEYVKYIVDIIDKSETLRIETLIHIRKMNNLDIFKLNDPYISNKLNKNQISFNDRIIYRLKKITLVS